MYISFVLLIQSYLISVFFFFNDTATTEIYTLSLHDALPISSILIFQLYLFKFFGAPQNLGALCRSTVGTRHNPALDRKSTRLNSSHTVISYAVFCLKKKKKT